MLTRQGGERVGRGAARQRAQAGHRGQRGGHPAGRVDEPPAGDARGHGGQRQGGGGRCLRQRADGELAGGVLPALMRQGVGQGGQRRDGGAAAGGRFAQRPVQPQLDRLVLVGTLGLRGAGRRAAGQVGGRPAAGRPVGTAPGRGARAGAVPVVATVEPADRDRHTRLPQRLRRELGLVQTEQAVVHPLDEEDRCADLVQAPGRGVLAEQLDQLPVGGAVLCSAQEEAAHLWVEAPAERGSRGIRRRPGTRQRRAEEGGGPQSLERTGHSLRARRALDGARLRIEGRRQVVPGDQGHHRVDPVVSAGRHQGQRPAIAAAHDGDPGVARSVQPHLGPCRQRVQQHRGIGDLEVRGVQVDQPARLPEAAGGVGEHDVAGIRQPSGIADQVELVAAEAVGQQHGRRRCGRAGVRREIEVGVELDRRAVGLRTDRDTQVLGGECRCRVPVVPGRRQPDTDPDHHQDRERRGQRRARQSPQPAREGHGSLCVPILNGVRPES